MCAATFSAGRRGCNLTKERRLALEESHGLEVFEGLHTRQVNALLHTRVSCCRHIVLVSYHMVRQYFLVSCTSPYPAALLLLYNHVIVQNYKHSNTVAPGTRDYAHTWQFICTYTNTHTPQAQTDAHTYVHTLVQVHMHNVTRAYTYVHQSKCTYTQYTYKHLPKMVRLLLVPSLLRLLLSPLHTGSSVHEGTQYKLLPPPKCGKTPQTASHFSVSYCQLECDSSGMESSLLLIFPNDFPGKQLWQGILYTDHCLNFGIYSSSEWSHEPHYTCHFRVSLF